MQVRPNAVAVDDDAAAAVCIARGHSTTTIESNKVLLSSMNVGRPSETWIAATAMLSRDAKRWRGGGGHGDGTASATHTARVNLNLLGLTDIRRRATDVSVNRRSVWAGVAAAAQALLGSDYEAQCDRVSLPVSWSRHRVLYSECCLPW